MCIRYVHVYVFGVLVSLCVYIMYVVYNMWCIHVSMYQGLKCSREAVLTLQSNDPLRQSSY